MHLPGLKVLFRYTFIKSSFDVIWHYRYLLLFAVVLLSWMGYYIRYACTASIIVHDGDDWYFQVRRWLAGHAMSRGAGRSSIFRTWSFLRTYQHKERRSQLFYTFIRSSFNIIWQYMYLLPIVVVLLSRMGSRIRDACTASITVNNQEDLYFQVRRWVAEHAMSKGARHVRVFRVWEVTSSLHTYKERPGQLFNYKLLESRMPLRYGPMHGWNVFSYNGKRYILQTRVNPVFRGDQSIQADEMEEFQFTCLGWDKRPILELLEKIRADYQADALYETKIRRPVQPSSRNGSYPGTWGIAKLRRNRDIDTVDLGREQKEKAIDSMQSFFDSSQRYWDRGIPYRKGYLFYGPPGTGKSSLAFALAGLFGLDIFPLSLADKALTGNSLLNLFSSLPGHCIVLLEDIDRIVKEGCRVSMSDTLNAIDGVTTPEGHILIATANNRELLDEALVRPGRIDCTIEFTRATKTRSKISFSACTGMTRLNRTSSPLTSSSSLPRSFQVKFRNTPSRQRACRGFC